MTEVYLRGMYDRYKNDPSQFDWPKPDEPLTDRDLFRSVPGTADLIRICAWIVIVVSVLGGLIGLLHINDVAGVAGLFSSLMLGIWGLLLLSLCHALLMVRKIAIESQRTRETQEAILAALKQPTPQPREPAEWPTR